MTCMISSAFFLGFLSAVLESVERVPFRVGGDGKNLPLDLFLDGVAFLGLFLIVVDANFHFSIALSGSDTTVSSVVKLIQEGDVSLRTSDDADEVSDFMAILLSAVFLILIVLANTMADILSFVVTRHLMRRLEIELERERYLSVFIHIIIDLTLAILIVFITATMLTAVVVHLGGDALKFFWVTSIFYVEDVPQRMKALILMFVYSPLLLTAIHFLLAAYYLLLAPSIPGRISLWAFEGDEPSKLQDFVAPIWLILFAASACLLVVGLPVFVVLNFSLILEIMMLPLVISAQLLF